MNIGWGLHQTVTWTPRVRDEQHEPIDTPSGTPQYEEPRAIIVRFRNAPRRVVNREGAEVTCSSLCHATAEVREGDLLTYDDKDWPVIAINTAVWLDGKEKFRRVYM